MVEANNDVGASTSNLKVKIEFSGGLEMYFNNNRELQLEIPVNGPYNVTALIEKLRASHMSDKEEMFVQNGTVRPGIIVLINDTDWELED